MKKILLIMLFAGMVSPVFASAQWTVLIYMAADNSLSEASFKDINEMEEVVYNDSVNVIVQVDPNNDLSHPPYFTTCRRYEIQHDIYPDSICSILLEDLGEINSADPQQVTDFANWGFLHYPSQKTMLILWDHGNGWSKNGERFLIKSICTDYDGGTIGVANGELQQAISGITSHLDILDFDACDMQTAEVIGEVYNFCDIIIGSELTVPGDGMFYGANPELPAAECGLFNYLVDNPQSTSEEFAFETVLRYVNSYTMYYQTGWSKVSLSAIRTQNYLEFMNPLLYDFCSTYSDTIYHDVFENAYDQCYSINNESIDLREFYAELSNFGSGELSLFAEQIAATIDSMTILSSVVFQNAPSPDIGKMAIHYPSDSFSLNWEKYRTLDFVQQTGWDGFLAFYFEEYSGNDYPKISFFNIYSYNKLVTFSWDALAPTFMDVKYSLEYCPTGGSTFTTITDSTYITETHFQYNIENYGSYEFRLTAIDEFGNSTDTTQISTVAAENSFKFFPNPYNISDNEQVGKFIFSSEVGENATIYIYNFSGNLVKKIESESNESGVVEVPFNGDNFASGIYFCILKCGGSYKKIKLAIVR
ncbi:MAG: clostripain-related cysteine peptidase [Candidatus Cloacimonadota bacterium]|nr:clostripain-related cysteine peptidase [Candidatus Cloacimonadota bacterium]